MDFVLLRPTDHGFSVGKYSTSEGQDEVYSVMDKVLDGMPSLVTNYFDGLPENVDAWCNDICLYRADFAPILKYHIYDEVRETLTPGLLKGNILFTAVDEDGDTLGLTEKQIDQIVSALKQMPTSFISDGERNYPVLFKLFTRD